MCLLTGDAGADATSRYQNPDLLGHVYVGPYILGEPDLALIAADGDGVTGYCLATSDTRGFAAWADREWWPTLRAEFPRRSDSTPDADLIELLHEPPSVDAAILDAYPAHLHLDLIERARGSGVARRLVERQLRQLVARGAAACHLVAATSNRNAIGFYEHLGWRVLDQRDDDTVMGLTLR